MWAYISQKSCLRDKNPHLGCQDFSEVRLVELIGCPHGPLMWELCRARQHPREGRLPGQPLSHSASQPTIIQLGRFPFEKVIKAAGRKGQRKVCVSVCDLCVPSATAHLVLPGRAPWVPLCCTAAPAGPCCLRHGACNRFQAVALSPLSLAQYLLLTLLTLIPWGHPFVPCAVLTAQSWW